MVAGKPALMSPSEEQQERRMVEAARQDPTRFAELYQSNFERVYAFVVRRVNDRADAEDVTSEVFHKALANLARFKWQGVPFAAWLMRIARNIIADRAKRVAKEHDLGDFDEGADVLQSTFEDVERLARLFRLVDQLPEDQRLVLKMRFAGDQSIREIAHELGRSEGAVKQLQFRGLQNLRATIGESDG